MKNTITKGIIMIAAVTTASIYLIDTIEISIPFFILILVANIMTISIVGYSLKNTINNHFNTKH